MSKKITISLHGIVDQMEAATKKLVKAKADAVTAAEKQQLGVKIQNLEKIKSQVIVNCPKGKPSYGIKAIVK